MRNWRHGDPLGGNASRIFTKAERPEYKRRHYRENKAKYLARAAAQPKEKTNEYKRRWKAKNPAKVLVYGRLRKRRQKEATPPWLTPEHWAEMNEFYFEAQRLTVSTGVEHHVDHIVPIADSVARGLHVPWNLRVMTAKDNMARPRAA